MELFSTKSVRSNCLFVLLGTLNIQIKCKAYEYHFVYQGFHVNTVCVIGVPLYLMDHLVLFVIIPSPFLFAEASYAYKLDKKIVPLLLGDGYNPDGWLGILQGMDLYYALHSDEQLEQNFGELLKVLGETTGLRAVVVGAGMLCHFKA